ncbi:MAG: tetratricopeptide repeat protein [Desulfuromonadaceae bacterium]|nr:tetratricopeptide repeat protein [Desulfuromonadaceae bacterium]MDD5104169.1 tetratricopeptide repeat protein [Desulfuromonadaceae bacterium]
MREHYTQLLCQAEHLANIGKLNEADTLCQYLVSKDPNYLDALFLSGNIAFYRSRWHEAADYFRRAAKLAPDNGVVLNNYGLALLEVARNNNGDEAESLSRAVQVFERATELDPNYFSALINLGLTYKELGSFDDAASYYHIALRLEPRNPDVWMQLGTLYSISFNYDEAIKCYLHLLDLSPTSPSEVFNRIAALYCYTGEIDNSVEYFRKSVDCSSIYEQARHFASNRLFHLHYLPHITPEEISRQHYLWGKSYFSKETIPPFLNSPEPDRIIKIGYVSGDFRMNAVSFFIQPVLAAHDPKKIKIYCYSNVLKKDIVTKQLIQHHKIIWREIAGITDTEACAMIRNDEIDILIDLSGHSGEHRLSLFALRPAPIQATWIGYPDTTGLPGMDYRITDFKADPPGLTEHLHTEKLLRLPISFLCYNPGRDFPREGEAPVTRNGYVTFGSMSNFSKINEPLLDIWCHILASVPDSQLVLRYRGQESDRIKNKLCDRLELNSESASRLVVLGHARSVVEQMEAYRSIDIALDTFPYHGTTTTCEALYMGVPVITLAGRSHLSRVGVSLLETVGLQDFIANDPGEYIEKAVALASNLPLLTTLRRNLRTILLNSPLCDNVSFTARLEEAYRSIWIQWCNNLKNNERYFR